MSLIQDIETNPKYTEILRLDEMLIEANIPHSLCRCFDGWQIQYCGIPSDKAAQTAKTKCVCDVIENRHSGGARRNQLEIMGLLTTEEKKRECVRGFLSAEEVFLRITEHYRNIAGKEN